MNQMIDPSWRLMFLTCCLIGQMASGCGDSEDKTALKQDLGSTDVTSKEAGAMETGPGENGCPATLPAQGSSCTVPTNALQRCDYFKQASQCNYEDLYWHCSCGSSGWECQQDYEDCPCPEIAPQSGVRCDYPGPSTCEYPLSAPMDGGLGGILHCECDAGEWECVNYVG